MLRSSLLTCCDIQKWRAEVKHHGICHWLYLKRDQPTGRVETDSADVGHFEFLTKHVDHKKSQVTLHRMVDAFLGSVSDYDTRALKMLHTNKVLANSDVFQTLFCVMMFSVASFQVAEKKEDIQNPSLFVEAFLRAAATIESFYKDPESDHAEFYCKDFQASCRLLSSSVTGK